MRMERAMEEIHSEGGHMTTEEGKRKEGLECSSAGTWSDPDYRMHGYPGILWGGACVVVSISFFIFLISQMPHVLHRRRFASTTYGPWRWFPPVCANGLQAMWGDLR